MNFFVRFQLPDGSVVDTHTLAIPQVEAFGGHSYVYLGEKLYSVMDVVYVPGGRFDAHVLLGRYQNHNEKAPKLNLWPDE